MICGKDRSFGPMSREHFVPKGLWAGKRPDRTVTLPLPFERAFNDAFRLWVVGGVYVGNQNISEVVVNDV
jgi:hypothetical protein